MLCIVDARWREEISKRIEYKGIRRVDTTSFRFSASRDRYVIFNSVYIGFRNVRKLLLQRILRIEYESIVAGSIVFFLNRTRRREREEGKYDR